MNHREIAIYQNLFDFEVGIRVTKLVVQCSDCRFSAISNRWIVLNVLLGRNVKLKSFAHISLMIKNLSELGDDRAI